MTHGKHRAQRPRKRVLFAFGLFAVASAASITTVAVAPGDSATVVSSSKISLAADRGEVVSRSGARAAITLDKVVKAAEKPKVAAAPAAPPGLNFAPCGSSSVEIGLQPGAVRLYRAVCNAFPGQISHFGGLGAGEHATGKAIDFMVYGNAALGQRVADFLHAHAYELNLFDIIWQQHIWTPVRAGEGWRAMPDRGGITANHFDHVHSSVN